MEPLTLRIYRRRYIHWENTGKERRRGTCAIREEIPKQGYILRGTGSLVKDFFENSSVKVIYLITSDKVISSDDLSRYFLWFKKLNGKVKERRPLLSVGDKVIFKSPGLAIVPVDRNKFSFIRKSTSGLLHHRPFTLYNEENEGGIISESYFHAALEFGESFEIRPYPADQISTETESISQFRKSLGAPILITSDGEAKLWVPVPSTKCRFLVCCFHRLIGIEYVQVGNYWQAKRTCIFSCRSILLW